MDNTDTDNLRELAQAMNNLAGAIKEFNELVREAKAENPDWQKFPSALAELNRRLNALTTRL